MRTFIIFLTLLFGIVACKKDLSPNNNPGTGNPTTNNPGGDDGDPLDNNQKVRIVRVEQTVSPNSFPFDTDELMSVDYHYENGILKGINVWRGGDIKTYYNPSTRDDIYSFDVSSDLGNTALLYLKNINVGVEDNRIVGSSDVFELGISSLTYTQNNMYTYDGLGKLDKINTNALTISGTLPPLDGGGSIQVNSYSGNLVSKYSIEKKIGGLQNSPKTGREINVQATYQKAGDVPTDLIRKVNQAILGLSPMGFEAYYFHQRYDLLPEIAVPEGTTPKRFEDVDKFQYTFADWIVSFGITNGYSIPEQGNQLIQSKHIQGRKMISAKFVNDAFYTEVKYANIDSTAQYTYIHHSAEKMLEIAGLKIYYEWVGDSDEPSTPVEGEITDPRDGERYKTVQIGTQTWFAENLRYAGDFPNITDDDEWRAIYETASKTPAWSYYNNDPSNNESYGKLYNWWAVNTGTLCPQGWHIPSNEEWNVLRVTLGGEVLAGGKIKSTTEDWKAPNTNATNESGFNGLPGGKRRVVTYPSYYSFGEQAGWWSSTPIETRYDAYIQGVDYKGGEFYQGFQSRSYGYSCRCIKD